MTNATFSSRFLTLTLVFSLIFGGVIFAEDGHDHAGHNHEGHNHGTVQTEVDDLHHEVEADEEEFDASSMIMHHIADAHDWHFWGHGEHAVSLPLPVILYSSEGGLAVFMSSAFHHDDAGTVPVEKNGVSYLKFHEKIYVANAAGGLDMDEHHHPTNAMPLDLSVTKNVAAMLFAAFVLVLMFSATTRGYKANGIPTGIGKYLEPLVIYVRDEIAIPNIGEKKANKFLPYLLTVFFFIWIINILGLFPTGANLTGNIAFTFTLSFFTLLITNTSANKDYWLHILWPPVPLPMKPLMIVVEVIGIFTKPFALMMRLFANITAGHILMLSLVSLIFMFKTALMGFVSVPFMLFMTFLELLVAALQAYIFTLLSALFIGLAVAEHDHEHEAEGAH